jgi:hypothetical protein
VETKEEESESRNSKLNCISPRFKINAGKTVNYFDSACSIWVGRGVGGEANCIWKGGGGTNLCQFCPEWKKFGFPPPPPNSCHFTFRGLFFILKKGYKQVEHTFSEENVKEAGIKFFFISKSIREGKQRICKYFIHFF